MPKRSRSALVQPSTQRPLRYWSPWLGVFALAWALAFARLAPHPAALAASNWPLFFVGFAGAVLGNVSAVGGGIVFIPAMMFVYHLDPVSALKVALASQCFGMTSGAIGWVQRRAVPLRLLAPTVPGLLLGSTLGALVVRVSPLLVKSCFGPVSVALGLLTLALLARERRDSAARPPARVLGPAAMVVIALVSVVGGVLTAWVAIGEGEVVAATLMLAYGVEASAAIGLGVVLLAINSLYLGALHQVALGGIPWEIAAFTGFGCVFGARLGPWVSQRFSGVVLQSIFAAIAIADGLLFTWQAWRR